jgi:hypothetical protein
LPESSLWLKREIVTNAFAALVPWENEASYLWTACDKSRCILRVVYVDMVRETSAEVEIAHGTVEYFPFSIKSHLYLSTPSCLGIFPFLLSIHCGQP